jgi:SAM-dependent methyltransferase
MKKIKKLRSRTIVGSKEIFTKIYEENAWGFGSGTGSTKEYTEDYRNILENFIVENNIKSVIDYGCGDWQSTQFIDWNNIVDSYIGVDIVGHLIEQNNEHFESEVISFKTLEHFEFHHVDLIICKDVLQHLSNDDIENLINQMTLNCKFILLTNDIDETISVNENIKPGGHRLTNPYLYPFNFNQIEKIFDFHKDYKKTYLIRNDKTF